MSIIQAGASDDIFEHQALTGAILRLVLILARSGPFLIFSYAIAVLFYNLTLPRHLPQSWIFEAPALLLITNTLVSIVAFAVAALSLRGYLTGGPANLINLGGGMLALGAGAFAAGCFGSQAAANVNLTIHNSGVLLAATFHFIGCLGLITGKSSPADAAANRKTKAAAAYASILILVGCIVFMAVEGFTPPFTIPGSGPTLLRSAVLSMAIAFFGASFLILLIFDREKRNLFLSCYAWGLGLLAISLISLITSKQANNPLSWLGRSAQALAALYFLASIIAAVRMARASSRTVPYAISDFFRPSEALYRDLVETANDAIVPIGADGRVLFWNTAAGQVFGYSREEAARLVASDLLDPEDSKRLFRDIEAGITSKKPYISQAREAKGRRKAGDAFPAELSFSSRPTGGRFISTLIIRDITERKKAEELIRKSEEKFRDELELRIRERTAELNATVARLKQLNQELQEFAHVASHDLQEPLRKIQTFCDMAMRSYTSEPGGSRREYLERIFNSASRMRQLLDDLLQFSRMATKPEPFKKLDLAGVAREAANVFEKKLEDEGGSVEIRDLPGIEAHETLILRLFQNLIGNALKFRGSESPRIEVYGNCDGKGEIEIFVKDNGIGFDQKFAERIFKPFQRLHNRAEYEGTGMGLAICRKIAERHGGSIRAESGGGKGSVFIIRLPVRQHRWESA